MPEKDGRKITITGPEDLGELLTGFEVRLTKQQERLDALPDPDSPGGVKALAGELKGLREIVDDMARRRVPVVEGGKLVTLSRKDFEREGIKAVFTAATPIKLQPRQFGPVRFMASDPDGPVAEWQDRGEKLYLLALLLRRPNQTHEQVMRSTAYYREEYLPAWRGAAAYLKANEALDLATGEGGDWVPTTMSARLIELIRLEKNVAALFEEIAMPRSPFVFPTFLSKIKGFKMTEQTAVGSPTKISVGQPATISTKFTLTAVGVGTRMATSKFLEEDSIVPILPLLQAQMAEGLSDAREDAVQNGDATGAHQDNDTETGAADLAAKSWDGLRLAALAKTAKVDLAAKLDTDPNWRAGVAAVRAKMGKYAAPRDCAIIVGPKLGYGQVPYVEAFRTAYAIAMATNVSGEILFRPDGCAFLVSEFQREDVAATGVNTAAGPNDKATALIVNRRAWLNGQVREITVQVGRELYMESDQDVIVATARWAFGSPYAAADNHTGIVYDILT